MTNYSHSISLECPYCDTKSQFSQISHGHSFCKSLKTHHIAYTCTNCGGIICTKRNSNTEDISLFEKNPAGYGVGFCGYAPIVGDWQPKVKVDNIENIDVRGDYLEAISCYHSGFYNACMMMARRTIQQEMILKTIKGDNLYDQIENSGISPKLKQLLQKIKNFGNYGAHPDFFLYDDKGKQLIDPEQKKDFAKLSLEFLDKYFVDEYEIDLLISNSPKSEKELE